MKNLNGSTSLAHSYLKILAVVFSYWVISISIVFINKTLFSSSYINIKAPLLVTWMQCVISTIICFTWQKLAKLFPKSVSFPTSDPFSLKTIKTVAPLSILYILTIGFGNLSLSFVEVSFYFISRSLTTVFNVIFTYIILNEKTSFRAILCCVVIIFGFILGVDQENFIGTLSFRGTSFGVFSSVALSLYSIFTKKVLPSVNNEVILLSYYNNLYSSLMFVPIIYFNGDLEKGNFFNIFETSFWILITVSGIFGFMIGFVTTLQIKVTSPLTHNISGTAKACVQTVMATYWYDEIKSALWWFSNFLVLFGSAAYARVRQLEMAIKS